MTELRHDHAPQPGTPEWTRTISASKVPAILGISPWKSPYTLWHEMKGHLAPEPMDPHRAAAGHLAETFIADLWKWERAQEGEEWRLNAKHGAPTHELSFTDESLPFPNVATIDRRAISKRYHAGKRRYAILECKTAVNLNQWGEPGDPDAIPANYYAQVIFQMGVSGIHEAYVLAIDPQFKLETHPVTWDPDLYNAIVDRCTEWWQSLQGDEPPELDDTVSTLETVRGLHPEIERGTETEADPALATALLDAAHAEEKAKEHLTGLKSKALSLMGKAHILTYQGEKIADRRARGTGAPYLHINKKAQP